MTAASPASYADWKAPAEDGGMLLWPAGPELLRQTRENHAALASADHVRIQNAPLPTLRSAQRRWLGHPDDQLLFATGHQTELIHPGVWVKDALIHVAAQAAGGAAYHFAVDTDSPKHLAFRWPGQSFQLTDDHAIASAEWSGSLAPPSAAHVAELMRAFNAAAADWPFKPVAGAFLASMATLSLKSTTLDAAMIAAMHELDESLGLRNRAMIVSPVFQCQPYLSLVYHVLANACAFAADYNASLAEYRAETGITNPGRPMPDLRVGENSVEVPFWLDDLSIGGRRRAEVARVGNACVLKNSAGDDLPLDKNLPAADAAAALLEWLTAHNLRLAPRALMLTSFLRLLIADNFIHGIGGGRYDQVTDKLIARHFKFAAAEVFGDDGHAIFSHGDRSAARVVPCLLQEGHRLRHAVLGDRKQQWVKAIQSLPRGSRERSVQFLTLHRELAQAAGSEPVRQWEARLLAATQQLAREQQVFDRELFYAIQPAERLQQLLDLCRAGFESV